MQSLSSQEFQDVYKWEEREDGELTDFSTEMEDGELSDSSFTKLDTSHTTVGKEVMEYTCLVPKIPEKEAVGHFIGGNKNKGRLFDYYVIIDFEGTCGVLKNPRHIKGGIQEIIEFPAILLNGHNGLIEDEFQSFCRPVLNPSLTNFCKKFTGITQDAVDKAPLFNEVFVLFEEWLQKNQVIGSNYSFAVVTDGPDDIRQFLQKQCKISAIDFPTYCKNWINIKKTFARFYKNGNMQCLSLKNMIRDIGCEFQGRAHSGIDDARNIASIVQRLLTDGARVTFNEKLVVNRAQKRKIRQNSTNTNPTTQANPVKKRNLKVQTAVKKAKTKNPAKKTVPALKGSITKNDVKHEQIKSKKNRKRNAKRPNKKEQVHAKGLKTADNLTNTKQIREKLKLAAKNVRNLRKRLKSALHQENICSPILP
ncbi:ERI1 exoribonuclease 2-like isoform X3 [Daphnia pulex]|nr:ERI1 exoribonuclease 2-like isoform X3 [Daphnia pulex]